MLKSRVPSPMFERMTTWSDCSPVRRSSETEVGATWPVGGGRVVPVAMFESGPALPHSSNALTAKK
jgi:hypothetical protein